MPVDAKALWQRLAKFPFCGDANGDLRERTEFPSIPGLLYAVVVISSRERRIYFQDRTNRWESILGAIEDILEWSSTNLSPWKQDALRRLACQSTLTKNDHDEVLAIIKDSVGFVLTPKPAAALPLEKVHFGSASTGTPLHIKTIRNVENVNRLVPAANLTFAPQGLTVVYGRNGSGKSGFVRIFRTACRTRVEKPEKLKVLANVYGSGRGPQRAEIVIDKAGGTKSYHGRRAARLMKRCCTSPFSTAVLHSFTWTAAATSSSYRLASPCRISSMSCALN